MYPILAPLMKGRFTTGADKSLIHQPGSQSIDWLSPISERKGILMPTCVFIDLETSGLEPKVHGVTEIAAIAFDFKQEIAFEGDEGVFATRVSLPPDCSISSGTLEMRKWNVSFFKQEGTMDEIRAYLALSSFLHRHLGLDEYNWAGKIWAHNAPFDHGFLHELETRVMKGTKLHHRMFPAYCRWSCTMGWAQILKGFGAIPEDQKLNLQGLAAYFGLEDDPEAHTAVSDCITGISVARKLAGQSGWL